MLMKSFEIEWVKRENFKDAVVIKGVPGIGNISHICVDYMKTKLDAKLVAKIYSKYLPNVVVMNNDSTVSFPHFEVYYKKAGDKKLVFILGNYQPKDSIHSYEFSEELVKFLKNSGVKELITIAGIGYKDMPKEVKLHIALSDAKLQSGLKKYKELVFDGAASVALIIGSAGLVLSFARKVSMPAFSVLASTWAHPSHIGIKESRKVLTFLSKYLGVKLDLSDLDKEIRKINSQLKKISEERKVAETAETVRKNYIG